MIDRLRIFIGVDPGTSGACAVLACIDAPTDEAKHGTIAAFDVFDLPTKPRPEIGGNDLDVVVFGVRAAGAISNVIGGGRGIYPMLAVVEYPDLGGQMKGGRRQAVAQGLNAGMVRAALEGGLHVETQWVASRGWRGELGGVEKGQEFEAARAVLAGATGTHMQDCKALARTDTCVAVLLADLLRRRWLGTAVVPASKGAAKAAKSRKTVARKAALAAAIAPLTLVKARALACAEAECPDVHAGRAMRGCWCTKEYRCCESRLLNWAWRKRPDLPALPSRADKMHSVVVGLARVAAIYKKSVVSKAWMVAWAGDTMKVSEMDADTFNDLARHGLIQLQPGLKNVRYVPTERGLDWSRRLREDATPDLVPLAAAEVAR